MLIVELWFGNRRDREEFGQTVTSQHRTTDRSDAINSAVQRLFGRRAHWRPNHEVKGYGMVCRTLQEETGVSTVLADRVGVTVYGEED